MAQGRRFPLFPSEAGQEESVTVEAFGSDEELAGTDISNIRSGVLAAAITAGDRVVEQILRKSAYQLGVAVDNVVHLVAPDTIVLGGGLVEAMPDLFVTEVADAANQRVMPSFVKTFKVVAAELGDYATVMGAAAWARKVVRES